MGLGRRVDAVPENVAHHGGCGTRLPDVSRFHAGRIHAQRPHYHRRLGPTARTRVLRLPDPTLHDSRRHRRRSSSDRPR